MRGSKKRSSMRDGPVTAVRRIATCPVPPLSTPPTIELVSMGSVGCHVALSATAPSDAVRFPSGVLYTAWTSTLERSPSLRAKKRNDGYAKLTQTNGDCAEAPVGRLSEEAPSVPVAL